MYKEFVTREYFEGKWSSTYFDTMQEAKTLYKKILRAGGVSICLRASL